MDKPHEYEHIEWINSNQSRIQLSLLPGINESLNNRKAKINIVFIKKSENYYLII